MAPSGKKKTGPKTGKKAEKQLDIPQDDIDPPDFLSNSARVFWFEYRDLLVDAKMLTDADVAAFAAFCDQLALVEKADNEIETRGILINDARGSLKSNPAIGIKNRAWSQVLAFAKQLGLTPKARKVEGKPILPPAGGGVGNGQQGGPGANSALSTEARRARLFKVVN